MPTRRLSVRHTNSRTNTPLATLYGLPGEDADLTPEQLRALADELRLIADECEALHPFTRKYGPKTTHHSAGG